MHSFLESSPSARAWPLAICALASAVAACHSDRIAGEKSPSEVIAAAIPPPHIPPPKTVGFIWGVTGHPGIQAAYEGSGTALAKQFDYIDSLRAKYYRIDVYPDIAGNVDPEFPGVVNMAAARGTKLLPVLAIYPEYNSTYATNYNVGYSTGYNFANRYKGRFTYVEAGNELENPPVLRCTPGCPDGSSLTHYVDTLMRKTTSFLKGLTEGIHAGSPGTGVVINAGFLHYAFFQALQRDGVPFDTYGYHWYSDMEPGRGTFAQLVYPKLPDVNKEIWLTEANRGNTTVSPNNPSDQATVIGRYTREFYALPRVKALFIYELYEERGFLTSSPPNPPQAYFGLVGCSDNGCEGTRTLKPGFDAFRYGIEERLFGFEDYVYRLYQKANRRLPDGSGLAYWTNRFKSAPNDTLGLLNAFLPEESYKLFIKDQFVALLDRALTNSPTDSAGLVFWNDRMRSGSSRLSVIVDFCVTPEFWAKSGSTNVGFVDRLYLKLLRKSSSTDPTGRQNKINQLNGGVPKWDVVGAILSGREYQTLFLKDQYQAYLARTPNSGEVTYFVDRMQTGAMSQENVIRFILRVPEFKNEAVKAGYRRRG